MLRQCCPSLPLRSFQVFKKLRCKNWACAFSPRETKKENRENCEKINPMFPLEYCTECSIRSGIFFCTEKTTFLANILTNFSPPGDWIDSHFEVIVATNGRIKFLLLTFLRRVDQCIQKIQARSETHICQALFIEDKIVINN